MLSLEDVAVWTCSQLTVCNGILKWYLRVFSFRFLSLVLQMLSRGDLSPNILKSGLWSTAMVRFFASQDKVSCFVQTPEHLPLLGLHLRLVCIWIQQRV